MLNRTSTWDNCSDKTGLLFCFSARCYRPQDQKDHKYFVFILQLPVFRNAITIAAGGLKHTKISTSTRGFELATECCDFQVRPYRPDFTVTFRSLLPSRFIFLHAQLQQLQHRNTTLHYTRQLVALTLNTAHSTPDHLAASQAHVLYGFANSTDKALE